MRASKPDNLTIQVPCSARLTRPTRRLLKPPSDDGESLPAGQPHLFLLRQRSQPIKQVSTPTSWMTAKHPDQTLPFRLHLSDTVSLDLPLVAGESTPGQTILPFLVPHWRRLPVQHSGYCAPVGRLQRLQCITILAKYALRLSC